MVTDGLVAIGSGARKPITARTLMKTTRYVLLVQWLFGKTAQCLTIT